MHADDSYFYTYLNTLKFFRLEEMLEHDAYIYVYNISIEIIRYMIYIFTGTCFRYIHI